jgi:hypothetical protein
LAVGSSEKAATSFFSDKRSPIDSGSSESIKQRSGCRTGTNYKRIRFHALNTARALMHAYDMPASPPFRPIRMKSILMMSPSSPTVTPAQLLGSLCSSSASHPSLFFVQLP